jgi:hypothetical protein
MKDELERITKEMFVAYSRYCPNIILERPKKTTMNLSISGILVEIRKRTS